jgi:gas vesicle protein
MRLEERMASGRASNVLWFAAGLTLGAAAGLLYAPVRGAETRRYLLNHAGSARDYMDRGRELYEKGRELADEAANMYEEGRHLVEDQ